MPITVTTSFTAAGVPDALRIVATVPAYGAVAGVGQFLEVRLIGPDGVTGIESDRLVWTVVSGPFSFVSCTVTACIVPTDPNGYAAIAGMAWGAGPVTIHVTDGQVSQTFQFNAVTLPDVLQVVSAPGSGGYVGQTATVPFVVQAFFNGGVMPVSGRTVTVSVTNGSASLAACAGASSCTLTTDANGKISTRVTPLTAGLITLQINDGGVIASVSFTISATLQNAVTTAFVTVFVAEDAVVPETLSLAATQNGNAAAGQAVHWTSSAGFALAAADAVTDLNGTSSVAAMLGPLAGGTQASAAGCVWTNVCAAFNATGVAAANQQIVVVSGGQQAITSGAAYAPLQLEVVDGGGHPVVGAAVSASCPAQGRCPAAPVVASNVIVTTSGSDGMVWVTPITAEGKTQTEIAVSVGTQGFATMVLSSQN